MNTPHTPESRLPDNPAPDWQMHKNETVDKSWSWGIESLSTGQIIARCDTLETADLCCSAPQLLAQRDSLKAALEAMDWLVRAHDTYRGAGVASPSCWSIDDQTRRTQAMTQSRAALTLSQEAGK